MATVIDRIVSGHHRLEIEVMAVDHEHSVNGLVFRWRCSCKRGCRWKWSHPNVRWGANRHLKLAAHPPTPEVP